MIIQTINKNTVPFAVLCDVAKIDAEFMFEGCIKKSQLVQHVQNNTEGMARIKINDQQADRFIELFEFLEHESKDIPDGAVDSFLEAREVYVAIKKERNLNNE